MADDTLSFESKCAILSVGLTWVVEHRDLIPDVPMFYFVGQEKTLHVNFGFLFSVTPQTLERLRSCFAGMECTRKQQVGFDEFTVLDTTLGFSFSWKLFRENDPPNTHTEVIPCRST